MSFLSRHRRPQPDDYDTDEEYEEDLAAYETAEYRALEAEREGI